MENKTVADENAFPQYAEGFNEQTGLTKREYFAGQLLSGMVVGRMVISMNPAFFRADKVTIDKLMSASDMATDAVHLADALIAALNDPSKKH